MSVFKYLKSALSKSSEQLENQPEEQLYRRVIEASRNPALYQCFGVEDSLDGRFDMLCLHMVLVMRRLKADKQAQTADFSQKLFDIFFADMDLTLREMGVGDLGVARRVRQMSEAYMGRLLAYSQALDNTDEAALSLAVAHNLGRREQLLEIDQQCAVFMVKAAEKLEALSSADLLSGKAEPGPVFDLDRA